MNKNLYVVLMAGGVGIRFWPYSRNRRPKQFVDVLGIGKTLLQSTYERFLPLCPPENIFIVTHEEHAQITREQLPDLLPEQLLEEPMRKNTAPCIAYACYKIARKNSDAVIIVAPSDHMILNDEEFKTTILKSVEHAKTQDKLITLGIKPIRPETGYGYIQFLEAKSPLKKVKTFTEKPELALAKKFVDSGEFVWNSGIFIWGVQAILKSFAQYMPEMTEVFDELAPKLYTSEEKAAVEIAYGQCKSISIDYGILEKADNVYVWLSNFSWSDLGSWNSLYDNSHKDANNNAITGESLVYDVRNCIIKGSPGKLIVAQGLNGYLIGSFDDVVIICEKGHEEFFRRVVNDLKSKPNGQEFL